MVVLWLGWGSSPDLYSWVLVLLEVVVFLQDLQNLRAQNVCVMTDKKLSLLPPMKAVLESLEKNRVQYKVYDNVRVEPTDAR